VHFAAALLVLSSIVTAYEELLKLECAKQWPVDFVLRASESTGVNSHATIALFASFFWLQKLSQPS
jgi:hypothetical protein